MPSRFCLKILLTKENFPARPASRMHAHEQGKGFPTLVVKWNRRTGVGTEAKPQTIAREKSEVVRMFIAERKNFVHQGIP